MNLEGTVWSEIRHRKINAVWSHLYMEFKKNKVRNIKQIGSYQGQRSGEVEEIDEIAQKVQNSN